MDHLAVDGVHAEVTGAGSPVVLSHEGLLHSESWDAQVAALAAEHRVARWDRRGYGRSPRPTEASVADLAAVVRAVSDEPAALVDPWFVTPGNTAARERLRALLTANPQNLRPPMKLERPPETPALPRLGEIAVPTLIVVGEHDIPDVHAHSGALHAGVSGATRVVVPGSGHLPHLEAPEAFTRLVCEFLTEG
jgi:pimeloyl-ACP methyl ester carboxylesterase